MQMCPYPTNTNGAYRSWANPETFSQVDSLFSGIEDVFCVLVRKYGVVVPLAALKFGRILTERVVVAVEMWWGAMSALGHRILHVVLLRSQKQMVGPRALGVVAFVQDGLALWYGTDESFVRKPMRSNPAAGAANNKAVGAARPGTLPSPAARFVFKNVGLIIAADRAKFCTSGASENRLAYATSALNAGP